MMWYGWFGNKDRTKNEPRTIIAKSLDFKDKEISWKTPIFYKQKLFKSTTGYHEGIMGKGERVA